MKKLNHAGVAIEIPDDKKYQAILSFRDGTEIRVNRKGFETPDAFLRFLEMSCDQINALDQDATIAAGQASAARTIFEDAVAAVDHLKLKNFDGVEDAHTAFVLAAEHRLKALRTHKASWDQWSKRARVAQATLEALKADLARVEK